MWSIGVVTCISASVVNPWPPRVLCRSSGIPTACTGVTLSHTLVTYAINAAIRHRVSRATHRCILKLDDSRAFLRFRLWQKRCDEDEGQYDRATHCAKHLPPGTPDSTSARLQDRALLALVLLVGEHALCVQRSQLRNLVGRALCHGSPSVVGTRGQQKARGDSPLALNDKKSGGDTQGRTGKCEQLVSVRG